MGETASGDPIFEVRSVRLVLREDAAHFHRVAACSKCGSEVPGAAVLSPADLDLTPHPVICKNCVSTAGSPLFETEPPRPLPPPPPAPLTMRSVNGSGSGQRAVPPAEDTRLAALEWALADLAAQVSSAAGAVPVVDDTGARLDAIERRLEQAIEDLTGRAQLRNPEVAALEGRLHQLQTDVELEAGRGREEVARLVRGGEEQSRAWDEMGRRVDHVGERLTQDAESGRSRVQDIEERVQRLQGAVDAAPGDTEARTAAALERADAEQRQGLDSVNEGLQRLVARLDTESVRAESERAALAEGRADMMRAETQLGERLDGLAERMVLQRADLLATLDGGITQAQAAIAGEVARAGADAARAVSASEKLDEAQVEMRRGLDVVTQGLQELGARVDDGALHSEAGVAAVERAHDEMDLADAQLSERLDGLSERVARSEALGPQHLEEIEQRTEEAVGRLARDLESHRAQLESALAAVRSEGAPVSSGDAARLRALEEHSVRSQADVGSLEQAHGKLERLGAQFSERLDRLAERVAQPEPLDTQGLEEVEQRTEAAVGRLAQDLESQRIEVESALADVRSDVVAASSGSADQLRALEERIEHVVSSPVGPAAVEGVHAEFARFSEELSGRLDGLAERVAHSELSATQRLEEIGQWTEEAIGLVARDLESQRGDVESDLADVRSNVVADSARLRALEDRAKETAGQLAEIDELLNVLDGGFGELRSGIEALREAETSRLAAEAGIDRGPPVIARVEPEVGRRHGRKSEVGAHLAAVSATTDDLVSKYRHLEAQLVMLERTLGATASAVARASSQSAAVVPLRDAVASFRRELAEHDEALTTLGRSVEALRGKAAPAAAKATPPAKPAEARKVPTVPKAAPAPRKAKD